MERTKEEQKEQNKARSKEEITKNIKKIIDNENTLVVESNKQRVNISINGFVWDEISKLYPNKSDLVETLLTELLEKKINKKIKKLKKKDNY